LVVKLASNIWQGIGIWQGIWQGIIWLIIYIYYINIPKLARLPAIFSNLPIGAFL
jgi:uncharacterized membrane protein YagU involved in acid resistance